MSSCWQKTTAAADRPNILELLCAPAGCILQKHPLFDQLRAEDFLSKLCKETFAGYAVSQIKKARGLNKKIVNPLPKKRKSLLHFCCVLLGAGSQPVLEWLARRGWNQANCGLVNVPHARDTYALFYDQTVTLPYQGIISRPDSNAVSLSSVPRETEPVAYLYVNHDGYSSYCKDYREYLEWVEKRNDARYQNTLSYSKNYDAKNMMHTFRLLDMAGEILETGRVLVRRPNRDELLQIRTGQFEYDGLIMQAEAKVVNVEAAAAVSPLPNRPDLRHIERVLVAMRRAW